MIYILVVYDTDTNNVGVSAFKKRKDAESALKEAYQENLGEDEDGNPEDDGNGSLDKDSFYIDNNDFQVYGSLHEGALE